MAGNVAGAGIHEVAISLVAGAGIVVKTATAEPIFFEAFVRTLAEIDPTVAHCVAVLNWGRERTDLSGELLANCDRVMAYGDDSTIASLHANDKVLGFGSRVSAAVVAPSALARSRIDAVAESLARDVVMFEQLGCLSPHQIIVVSPALGAPREFAAALARALEGLSESMPPATLALRDACEIRTVRDRARWRRIAGDSIELFEGPDLGWTLVCD
ncbi:MAG TPA: acyl-CoA reductase, partial [Candidatus Acidoferrales bacterium]|nr:acyl-CoA reductase [Candidatus Acidoferrales bacterium]